MAFLSNGVLPVYAALQLLVYPCRSLDEQLNQVVAIAHQVPQHSRWCEICAGHEGLPCLDAINHHMEPCCLLMVFLVLVHGIMTSTLGDVSRVLPGLPVSTIIKSSFQSAATRLGIGAQSTCLELMQHRGRLYVFWHRPIASPSGVPAPAKPTAHWCPRSRPHIGVRSLSPLTQAAWPDPAQLT